MSAAIHLPFACSLANQEYEALRISKNSTRLVGDPQTEEIGRTPPHVCPRGSGSHQCQEWEARALWSTTAEARCRPVSSYDPGLSVHKGSVGNFPGTHSHGHEGQHPLNIPLLQAPSVGERSAFTGGSHCGSVPLSCSDFLHSSKPVQSPGTSSSEARPLRILLRRGLSCLLFSSFVDLRPLTHIYKDNPPFFALTSLVDLFVGAHSTTLVLATA